MPLGRFAAYFSALAVVCLIAFPRAMGSVSPSAVSASSTAPCLPSGADPEAPCTVPDSAEVPVSPVSRASDLASDNTGTGIHRPHPGVGVRCDLPQRQIADAVIRFAVA